MKKVGTKRELIRRLSWKHEKHDESFSDLKWLTVIGNAAIGTLELLTGGTSALEVTADGLHNIGDVGAYAAQFSAEGAKDVEKVRRLRRLGHWLISSGSAVVGVQATHDLATHAEHTPNAGAMAAAAASVALNAYLGRDILGKLKDNGWKKLTSSQRDIVKHFGLVDLPSSLLAVGGALATQAGVHSASASAAIVSGALGAWIFRPTKHNLDEPHSCAVHGDHSYHGHAHEDVHQLVAAKPERTRRRRVAVLGAAAAAVVGLGLGQAPTAHAPEAAEALSESAPTSVTQTIVQGETFVAKPVEDKTITYVVQPGDSLWQIVDNELCERDCSDQAISEKVDDLAVLNQLSNLDLIFPAQKLALPTS